MEVTGIDATTGKVLWAHGLPECEDLPVLAGTNMILGDQQHASLPLKSGLAAVDIVTGETSTLSDVLGDTVLCEIEREPVGASCIADRSDTMTLVPRSCARRLLGTAQLQALAGGNLWPPANCL